ncbi:hypothetical protein BMS3Abin03_02858 [bacterium BMS3Abin03]|nr:hypothetical protein BMS3Abin03_02858 [bacterium BMS3Abin03]
MKKIILLVSLFFGLTVFSYSQSLNGRFTSAVYTFERFDTASTSFNYARTYQMLYFNFAKDNVSLKSYLNLEGDIIKSMTFDPRFRFYNFYLDVKKLWNTVYFKLGRQPLFNSAAGGVFDGLTLGAKYNGYDLYGYYGGNVPAYQKFKFTDDLKNDFVAGGKLTIHSIKNARIALSYTNKNFKSISYFAQRLTDELLDTTVLINNNSRQFEYLSGEVSYNLPKTFRINTRYEYDLNFSTTAKFEVTGRYEKIDNVGLSVYYNYRAPRIRYNSIFSVFDYGTTQEIEFGGDYLIEGSYKLFGKFANVSYKDDNSQRLSLGLSSPWGTISGRKTFGYAGELSSISIYTAQTILGGLLTPSFGFSYTRYRLEKNVSANDMTTLLVGLNYRPIRMLSFDVQGQYLNNKIYKDDFRLLAKLNYWFNTNFK